MRLSLRANLKALAEQQIDAWLRPPRYALPGNGYRKRDERYADQEIHKAKPDPLWDKRATFPAKPNATRRPTSNSRVITATACAQQESHSKVIRHAGAWVLKRAADSVDLFRATRARSFALARPRGRPPPAFW